MYCYYLTYYDKKGLCFSPNFCSTQSAAPAILRCATDTAGGQHDNLGVFKCRT